jgi:hypothetical protein
MNMSEQQDVKNQQSLTSTEMREHMLTELNAVEAEIVELNDEQLEDVAGGFSLGSLFGPGGLFGGGGGTSSTATGGNAWSGGGRGGAGGRGVGSYHNHNANNLNNRNYNNTHSNSSNQIEIMNNGH